MENNLSQEQQSKDSSVSAVMLFLAIQTFVLFLFDFSCLYMSSFSLSPVNEGSTVIGLAVVVSLPNKQYMYI